MKGVAYPTPFFYDGNTKMLLARAMFNMTFVIVIYFLN